jgi:hypothetical protein
MEKKDLKKANDIFKESLKINPKFASSWKGYFINLNGILIL